MLWLNPVHPTPNRDNGYDVADYYGVDPRLGSLGDSVELVHAAGDHGMRVIIDLVVNHTSDQHPWFVAARSSWDDTARAWYYHRFYAFQPDLNWSNPHVRAEITRVMGSGCSWGVGDSGWTRHRSSSS